MKRRLLFVLLVGVGCSPVPPDFAKKQEVKYVRTDILKLTGEHVEARIILWETNHSDATLNNVSVDYELFIEGRKLGAGRDVEFAFKAHETTEIPIPITIRYADLFKTTENLMKAIASGRKSIQFHLKTLITIRFLGIPIEIPHETQGDLPLPDVKLPRVKL